MDHEGVFSMGRLTLTRHTWHGNPRIVPSLPLCVSYDTWRGDREGYNFGYKEMSEDSGPGARRCPKRILDMLTPTEHLNALEWRQRCRAHLRSLKEKQRDRGEIIRFSHTTALRLWRGTRSLPL